MTNQLPLTNLALPPPASLRLDLLDGDHAVGWVNGGTIGFRGFANAAEAVGAAWVAHRTLSRRLAHRHGGRPVPIDIEPLSLARDGDGEVILASNRPIATLLRLGVDSRAGSDSFGFEVSVPLPPDELTMRSIAYRVYRTLRKSGVRWALWEKRRLRTARRAAEREQPLSAPAPRPTESSPSPKSSPSPIALVSKLVLSAIAIVIGAAVMVTAPPTVSIPIGIVFVAGLVASGFAATVDWWRRRRSGARLTPRATDEEMRRWGWLGLGAMSMTVLAVAVVVPDTLATPLALIGFAGLVVFRLTAAWAGWLPRDPAYTDSR